jgi:hypothetical protein
VPPKRRVLSDLHGVTIQNIVLCIWSKYFKQIFDYLINIVAH